MNKAILVARLVTDPAAKIAKTGNKMCSFRVAVDDNRGDNKHTDFLNVTTFGKTAENCERYLAKGRQVAIEGKIHTDSYENRDGKKVYTTEIWASSVEFIGGNGGNSAPKKEADVTPPPGFTELEESELLPF